MLDWVEKLYWKSILLSKAWKDASETRWRISFAQKSADLEKIRDREFWAVEKLGLEIKFCLELHLAKGLVEQTGFVQNFRN